jgi:hypothetical protein
MGLEPRVIDIGGSGDELQWKARISEEIAVWPWGNVTSSAKALHLASCSAVGLKAMTMVVRFSS